MSKAIVILVVSIIVLIIVGFFVLPLLGAIPFSATMTNQWYKDGKPVGNTFGFVNPIGQEVDTLRVTVSWTASGSNVDESTFGLGGWVKIFLDQPYQGAVKTQLDSYLVTRNGAASMVGNTYGNFALDTLLANHMDWKDVGWTIVIEGQLTAQITDLNGEQLTQSWSGSKTFKLTWSTTTSTFTLTGAVGA